MSTRSLTLPLSEKTVRALRAGDAVRLSGAMVTARDAAHKYLVETFIDSDAIPEAELPLYDELKQLLDGGAIYHCGPVVRQVPPPSPRRVAGGEWQFVAAGPTTSIREETYEPDVIAHFGVRAIVGKGGMGPATLRALQEHGALYLHAVGGAASLIAHTVKDVLAVHKKKEFGAPEALWIIRVEGFPAVVTMDSHGRSIHDEIAAGSAKALNSLLESA